MELNLFEGNSLDILASFADCAFDSIVTDPPYELGFMGKQWDASGIAYNTELWQQCLRVLKPGGYLLAFGGTRTYHRMAVAIEDAGFEIRDSIHWIYGSGFPKSHDVSKAIDKQLGVERSKIRVDASEIRNPKSIKNGIGIEGGDRPWMQKALEVGYHEKDSDEPASPEAKQWDGWGTALKPAHEPIVMARKPLDGTIANTVLTWGTGALNISANRIGLASEDDTQGRWPANIVLDGTPEIVDKFPRAKGGAYPNQRGNAVATSFASGQKTEGGQRQMGDDGSAARFFAHTPWDDNDLSSFLYCPKPNTKERNAGLDGMPEKRPDDRTEKGMGTFAEKGVGKQANFHPTVKPLTLMRWLVRLVTPEGGRVLDPFAGSGTTLAAAILENRQPTGIELTNEYHPIIKNRCEWAAQQKQTTAEPTNPEPEQQTLFS